MDIGDAVISQGEKAVMGVVINPPDCEITPPPGYQWVRWFVSEGFDFTAHIESEYDLTLVHLPEGLRDWLPGTSAPRNPSV